MVYLVSPLFIFVRGYPCVIDILILFFSRGFVTFDKMEAADQAIAEVIFLTLFLEMWAVK